MKFFILVISIYLLLLSVAPCHCQESVRYDNISDRELTLTGSNQQHGDSATNFHCTPFCRCSNIHNPNFLEAEETKSTPFTLFVKKYAVYKDIYISTLYYRLWQPPQT